MYQLANAWRRLWKLKIVDHGSPQYGVRRRHGPDQWPTDRAVIGLAGRIQVCLINWSGPLKKGSVTNVSQAEVLCQELERRRLPSGGWAYLSGDQASVEATCLAILGLHGAVELDVTAGTGLRSLLEWQNADGSWPAFARDSGGSWTTSLALITVSMTGGSREVVDRAARSLVEARGREAHWLWRWKFKTIDRQTGIDPDKFGWPWIPGTTSWVIPTAFAIIALKQFSSCDRSDIASRRIRTGIEMLVDRACIGGGWNAGNRAAYGMALAPHAEATAVALMALQDEPRTLFIEKSLDWLRHQGPILHAVSSLAWTILSLFLFGVPVDDLKSRLAVLVGHPSNVRNNATLAIAALGLRCGETTHPFALTR
jgi:hypothetical protein